VPRARLHGVLRPLRRHDQEPVGDHRHGGGRAEDCGAWQALGVSGRIASVETPGVVDLALLARGFHIVSAPRRRAIWPGSRTVGRVYKHLTDHGFSKKP